MLTKLLIFIQHDKVFTKIGLYLKLADGLRTYADSLSIVCVGMCTSINPQYV